MNIFRVVWIAFCSLAMLVQTRLLLVMPLAPDWIDGFVFGGTVFGYHCTNPNRIYRGLAWILGGVAAVCFILPLLQHAPAVDEESVVALVPVLLWLAYYGFQRPGKAGLRSIPLAKPLTVAFTWVWVTVLLPVPAGQWQGLLFVILGRAAFIFALALAYDLSDAGYDREHSFETLVVKMGGKRSFALICACLIVSALCVFVNARLHVIALSSALGLLVSLFFSTGYLFYLFSGKGSASWQKVLIDALMPIQLFWVALFMQIFHFTS